MDLRHVFLRYSFVFNLGLLFLLAWVGAGSVNQALANRMLKNQGQPVSVAAVADAPAEFSADIEAISRRDLFSAGGSTAQPADGGTADGGPSQTELRLKLLGILFFGFNNPRNIATIQNLQDQKADVYRVGLEVQSGVKLAEIEVDRVLLDRGDGRLEELLFENAEGKGGLNPVAAAPRAAPGGPPEGAPAGGVQQVSDTEFVVQQAAIGAALNNMSSLMTQARIIPNFVGQGEERKVDGFRIFRIQPNSVFKSLGLNDGDVIKSINGDQMDSLEKGLTMLKGLVGQSQFTIQIERQREPRTHNYKVQ